MNNNPLFSILIANYNNGQYLQETIESVKVQDYIHWEIIIVDDASTDNSIDIYKKYADDNRIKIYYNSENKGVTYTKWRCLEVASGEICGFLDADDSLLPNALSIMVNEHLKDKNISIISSRHYICNTQMQIIKESEPLKIPKGESYLTYMHYGPNHFVSFKRDKYRQTQRLNPQNKIGDDQELYLLLEEVGKWHTINNIIYKYRLQENSLSHKKDFECWYWNIIIYHEACMRRNLNPMEYSYNIYKNICHYYITKGITEYLNTSKPYKIGLFILKPLSKIKNIINLFKR